MKLKVSQLCQNYKVFVWFSTGESICLLKMNYSPLHLVLADFVLLENSDLFLKII